MDRHIAVPGPRIEQAINILQISMGNRNFIVPETLRHRRQPQQEGQNHKRKNSPVDPIEMLIGSGILLSEQERRGQFHAKPEFAGLLLSGWAETHRKIVS
jgi:hypothetical protein